jgi:hypothetical protein
VDGIYKIADLEKPILKINSSYHQLILDFSYHEYNKDIVTAYQKDFIEKFSDIENFIDKQHIFINETLSLSQKIIINDYTKQNAFDFYRVAYAEAITTKKKLILDNSYQDIIDGHDNSYQDIIDGAPIRDLYLKDKFLTSRWMFGDSFYKQIFDVIGPCIFTNWITRNPPMEFIGDISKTISTYLSSIKNYTGTFASIDEYWNFLKYINYEREDPNSESKFVNFLTDAEWHAVLILYAQDINDIIAKSPECETDIYCYRGSKFDYIILNDKDIDTPQSTTDLVKFTTERGNFMSLRHGSFSFDFNKAKAYSKNEEGIYKYIYKGTIKKGVRVLYLPFLSYASHELEILHGGYANFTNRGDLTDSYNNINNKYGILSDEKEKFKSIDIELTGYNTGLKEKTINNDIVENIRSYGNAKIKRDFNTIKAMAEQELVKRQTFTTCDYRKAGGNIKKNKKK